jgi:AcrR family transcriptional regulator
VDAAREAIAVRGWDATTMEEIARAAGVSRMTLHRRGLTREGLLDALRESLVAEEREALWPALTSSGNARHRLALALSALCEVSERNLAVLPALADDVHDEVWHEPGEGALTRGEFTAPFRRLLEDGTVDGSLAPPGDLAELATVLYNQVCWTYRHLRTGHRWTPERACSAVVELAVRGVSA